MRPTGHIDIVPDELMQKNTPDRLIDPDAEEQEAHSTACFPNSALCKIPLWKKYLALLSIKNP